MPRNLLPQPIRDAWRDGRTHDARRAVVLFVDVAGFTALSERLMTRGSAGAELLAGAMQTLFDPMVARVHHWGGFVATFAGDAFTAVLPWSDDVARRGRALAEEIRQQVAERAELEVEGSTFAIAVKLGLAAGPVRWEVYGDTDGQRAFAVLGPAVDHAAQAEHGTRPGEIGLHPSFEALPTSTAIPVPEHVPHTCRDEVLRAFFPDPLRDPELTGEFRSVVSVFVSVDVPDDPRAVAEVLERTLALVGRFGGFLSKVDFGDKGCTLLLFWGAPRMRVRDVDRAAAFLLELRAEVTSPWRAGLTRRRMYAGFFGGPARCEYTCYGRGVTLAARLMMAAPWGETWVDGHLDTDEASALVLERRPAVHLKGYDAEQPVRALVATREGDGPRLATDLVGRTAELAALDRFLAPLDWQATAGTLALTGPPGMGKSRLLQAATASRPDIRWVHAACAPVQHRSLGPLRQLLRDLLGLAPGPVDAGDLAEIVGAHRLRFEEEGETERAEALTHAPAILAGVLGSDAPDDLWEGLTPVLRTRLLHRVTFALLDAVALDRPVVVVLDDVHWIDPDTEAWRVALGAHLASSPDRPLGLLTASRGDVDGVDTPLVVPGLDRDAVRSLSEQVLGASASDALVDLVVSKTAGNPFFVEQLTLELREADHLVQTPTASDWRRSATSSCPRGSRTCSCHVSTASRWRCDGRCRRPPSSGRPSTHACSTPCSGSRRRVGWSARCPTGRWCTRGRGASASRRHSCETPPTRCSCAASGGSVTSPVPRPCSRSMPATCRTTRSPGTSGARASSRRRTTTCMRPAWTTGGDPTPPASCSTAPSSSTAHDTQGAATTTQPSPGRSRRCTMCSGPRRRCR